LEGRFEGSLSGGERKRRKRRKRKEKEEKRRGKH
jgi:hypothetical protein